MSRRYPVVVIGVIERFVEPSLRAKFKEADDELRLVEDLGIDSLTMMEIVILVEDVLQMQINNDELRNLRTVGDVKTFIDCKVRGSASAKADKVYAGRADRGGHADPASVLVLQRGVDQWARGARESTRFPGRNFSYRAISKTIP